MMVVQPYPNRHTEERFLIFELELNLDETKIVYCKDEDRKGNGDRYYFVATKTCASKAISKDILTKRGLVSPLDYYEHKRNVGLIEPPYTESYVRWCEREVCFSLLDCV